MQDNHCDIAIIGASFAGLSAYLMLRKRLGKQVKIKIFDKREKFTYTPGLHECLGNEQRLQDLQFCLYKYYGEDFIHAEIDHIDEKHYLCTTTGHRREFDYGIIATGSKPQFFDKENRKTYGYTLRWAEDIPRLNKKFHTSDIITIIGGGISGVETASVIKQRLPNKTVQLVHSRDCVLHTMGSSVSHKATQYLQQQGVKLLLGQRLADVQADHIILADKSTHTSDCTIITAGVTADDAAHSPHLTFSGGYTSLESDNIYLAGDVAMDGLLPTAHNAFFEGRRAAHCVADKIQNKKYIYPPLYNRTNLAIALGTQDGIMTFKEKGVYLPRFTGFAKRVVEKRVMIEFKHKILLPI